MGDKRYKYAIGVDPASEEDNFAISVIEIHPDHKRIVYSWTITKREQKARLAAGEISENDFFGYCNRKIRELMKVFPTAIIGVDTQGGGHALLEAMIRTEGLSHGEVPLYPIIEHNDPKETDGFAGLHVIKHIVFADAKWVSEANNSLRLAFENKTLLFPHHDALSATFAQMADQTKTRLYDSLEDNVQEIEDLKDELSTIIMTSTDSGRDKWTTPDKKEPGMKKGKMRKDRYTALLIANYVADFYIKEESITENPITLGGFAFNVSKMDDLRGDPYTGPAWFTSKMKDVYD
jgi:hypothetical protein